MSEIPYRRLGGLQAIDWSEHGIRIGVKWAELVSMTIPRRKLVDVSTPLFYHLVSRCVRRSWLCGRSNGRDYSHRKEWIINRLRQLGGAFSVEIHAYAVMSTHFHLVVYYDPKACLSWSDDEVADRWLRVSPPRGRDGSIDHARVDEARRALLDNPERVARLRWQLGSLSMFMKFLKQPIARRANREDGCTGHFFDQRFYSGALLSSQAVVAAMAYVDLNPIRARIARSLEEIKHASIADRLADLENSKTLLDKLMLPLVSGLAAPSKSPPIALKTYIARLEDLIASPGVGSFSDKVSKWQQQVMTIRRRQRVFGSLSDMRNWLESRGLELREVALP